VNDGSFESVENLPHGRTEDNLEKVLREKWWMDYERRCFPGVNVAPPSWRLDAGWEPALQAKSGQRPSSRSIDLLQSPSMPPYPGAEGPVVKSQEPLKPYTTFKIGGPARFLVCAAAEDDIRAALSLATQHSLPLFVLGGGSNILVSDRGFAGVVVHPVRRGIKILHEDAESAVLEVTAAEAWDDVVRYAVERNSWGIENLSHIPGQAGAALVQNISAYGQQVSDVLESVQVMEVTTGALRVLSTSDCGLGYRRSIFNTTARGNFIIVKLTLRLAKHIRPNLDYPDVRAYFSERSVAQPSLAEIRQAIIAIRDCKFPYPREKRGGNVGSFFKNLSLTKREYARLQGNIERNFSSRELTRLEEIRQKFPSGDRIRIPTAFLIEICGLKGNRIGGAQVNELQPLVLLNQGGATAQDVIALAKHIRRTVHARTGLVLSIEPELVGFTKQEIADINYLEES
jgi:UDP-N-acetylmuramate dehydrogenase